MKKITVSQIAKKAEVSSATVSRVLNHRELVKESTILRVESAMRELEMQNRKNSYCCKRDTTIDRYEHSRN